MFISMLKSKIHRATVTQCFLNYEGSISIDKHLLDEANILPNEQVDVLNIMNGARFTTYAIEAPKGSGTIGINGAAARMAQDGDLVIVVAYAQMDAEVARNFEPSVLLMGAQNVITSVEKTSGREEEI